MSFFGPIAILLMVLSPVLVPAIITAWHAAAGSTRGVERRR
jgi:hypothetical protein